MQVMNNEKYEMKRKIQFIIQNVGNSFTAVNCRATTRTLANPELILLPLGPGG
jgi:hypothetical protein